MTNNQTFKLLPGKRVAYKGNSYRITQILSLQEVELVDEITLENFTALLHDIEAPTFNDVKRPDLTTISDKAWKSAESRLMIIKPLLNTPNRTRGAVTKVGKQHSVSTNTLYSWLKAYEASGLLSSLLPKSRRDKGDSKLDRQVEEIIQESITTEYLTKQRKSPGYVCKEVKKRCAKLNLPAPHDNTIRNRIKAIPSETKTAQHEKVERRPI